MCAGGNPQKWLTSDNADEAGATRRCLSDAARPGGRNVTRERRPLARSR